MRHYHDFGRGYLHRVGEGLSVVRAALPVFLGVCANLSCRYMGIVRNFITRVGGRQKSRDDMYGHYCDFVTVNCGGGQKSACMNIWHYQEFVGVWKNPPVYAVGIIAISGGMKKSVLPA